ncbi:TIGR03086 family metal-binding protein [Streptomyces spiralis]|uniref:TIGR03086 family metal-binding protein n=1 Tax=Streptomyces spiralis TaxID=66376 RepID=UPI0036C59078
MTSIPPGRSSTWRRSTSQASASSTPGRRRTGSSRSRAERTRSGRKAWASDERMSTPVRVPWGEVPGHAALSGYVMEIVTHTWDLAEALGHPLGRDPELAEFALATARRVLPDERPRGGETLFGARREAQEGADVYEQLAAWLGRTPLSRP